MRKRILSLLLCLIMALSLVPVDAFAIGYTEGDIPGTTGTGTKDDPVAVDTFYELRNAMSNYDVYYIRVDADINLRASSDTEYQRGDIIGQRGEKHLQLDHDVTYVGNYINTFIGNQNPVQYLIATNSYDLTLTGTGTLTGEFNRPSRAAYCSVIYGAGTTTIDGPTIVGTSSDSISYGLAVTKHSGKLVVISGTLKSYATYPWINDEPSTYQAYSDYPLLPVVELYGNATFDISGGTFISEIDPTCKKLTEREFYYSEKDFGIKICENVHPVALDVTDGPQGTITGGVFYNGIEKTVRYPVYGTYETVPVDFSNYVDTTKYNVITEGNVTRVESKQPADLTVTASVDPSDYSATATWNAIPNTDYYEVRLMRYDPKERTYLQSGTLKKVSSGTSCTFGPDYFAQSNIVGNDDWEVTVYAYSVGGSRIANGVSTNFSVNMPRLAEPAPVMDPNGTVHWPAVSGATEYTAVLKDQKLNTVASTVVNRTSFDFSDYTADGNVYRCYVSAVDANNRHLASYTGSTEWVTCHPGEFLGIWIGSTPVTSENRYDVLHDGGSVQFLSNGEAYNEDLHGNTLVLNNLNLTNPTYHTNADGHRAMLTIADDIAVVLIGENIIHPPKNGEIFWEDDLGSLDGVYIGQNMYVSFYGSGRLDVSVSRNNSALFSDNSTVMLNDNVTMRLSGKYGFNSAFSGIEVPWLELYDNSKLYAYGLRDDNDRDGLAINCPNITLGDNAYLYAEYEWNQQAVDTWDSNYKELSSTVLTIRGIRNQIGMVNTEWETLNSINTGSADDEGKFRALEIQAGKPSVLLGDVNNDGVVTDADAVYLLYYTFFGDGEYPVNQPCDFNGDGAVTDADAVYLLYYTFFGAEEYPLH